MLVKIKQIINSVRRLSAGNNFLQQKNIHKNETHSRTANYADSEHVKIKIIHQAVFIEIDFLKLFSINGSWSTNFLLLRFFCNVHH